MRIHQWQVRGPDRSVKELLPETPPTVVGHGILEDNMLYLTARRAEDGMLFRVFLNPDDLLLDLIYNEVVLREEDGEWPELDEYLRRFPQHAEDLRAQFDVHRALQSGRPFTLALSTASLPLGCPAHAATSESKNLIGRGRSSAAHRE